MSVGTGASRRPLPSAGAVEFGFGAYRARNYDELIDHPVEIADFALASFTAAARATMSR